MDQIAVRLPEAETWTCLGGEPESRKLPEVVLRAFDGGALFAVGETPDGPDESTATRVPAGEGRRLQGRFFFARSEARGRAVLVSYRGI